MATCDPSALLYNNPFIGLSKGLKLAVECELLRNWAGSTETPDQILARAKYPIDPGLESAIEAQLLCEIVTP